MITLEEQIYREQRMIAEISARLSAWRLNLRIAMAAQNGSMDSTYDLQHARLGVNAMERSLQAHKSSLRTIERRNAS